MRLEIMSNLALGDEYYCIEELLNMGVPLLGLVEDLANVVDGALNWVDVPVFVTLDY